jgi:hypothetical protein
MELLVLARDGISESWEPGIFSVESIAFFQSERGRILDVLRCRQVRLTEVKFQHPFH